MTQTLSERVAATVRAESGRRRVSQMQIAEALGLSQAAISRRLSGDTSFELDELPRVAALLDVSITHLIEDAA